MSHFRLINRKTDYLLPPSLDDWLPEDHLARFILEAIEQLDLSALILRYGGRGSAAYHPEVLLSLLVYGYATGTFSSRKIERATYDSIAFRYLAAGSHPDHDTLANFRRRFLDELADIFLQVLELAGEMKLLKLGTISLDGTKLHANASRHSALSYAHIQALENQLKTEVQELLTLAESADQAETPVGMDLPDEIKRRQDRLLAMAAAKAKIEARARVRFEQDQALYQEKLARRAARMAKTGKKLGGTLPNAPVEGPTPHDQINLTDEDSRIMRIPGGAFEQCYNAQAAVDADTLLIVAQGLTQAGNDIQQVAPMLVELKALPASLGKVQVLLGDCGYNSDSNIAACEAAEIEPYLAVARQDHHPGWRSRFAQPPALDANATAQQRMAHKLKTEPGRSLYALRKQTVEPVFGIIKSVMGFRQFLLRGKDTVSGEWRLVCMAWNLKRMAVMRHKSVQGR
jgi:transposase